MLQLCFTDTHPFQPEPKTREEADRLTIPCPENSESVLKMQYAEE